MSSSSALSHFSVGARVRYVINAYGVGERNPLQGTDFACDGTVYGVSAQTIYVRWDNGHTNDYKYNTLIAVGKSNNPNIMFKLKKNSWVK
jgi:hypothetical protein